jgi:metal-dependent amidase/aminoacylase/carboxypeptidase family protein
MPTSFYAEYGSGHPKICYLCEYDAIKDKGHITGHNMVTAMSMGAALGLSKIIETIGGSVVIIGCPGEYIGGSKVTMVKQGIFEDIDVVLMAHPDIVTAESGTSSAILPISIKYTSKNAFTFTEPEGYSSLDGSLFTFTGLNYLTKGFPKGISLDGIIVSGGTTPSMFPNTSESKFYIRASSILSAQLIEKKIRELITAISSLMDIESEISYYELPYKELISNRTLSRIFCHNLKENGIIDCLQPRNIAAGLSLGNVSHVVPCIHPYICIVENENIKYSSEEFGRATLSDFAVERMLNAAQALAITGFDILSKEELLNEIRNEFYSHSENKNI